MENKIKMGIGVGVIIFNENNQLLSFTNDKNQYAQFVTAGMIAKKYSGNVKVMEPDEIIDWKWFDLNNLPKNIYFPSEKLLKNYLAGKMYDKDL